MRAYKRLARVERAFRHIKTADLQLRPFYVRKQERVRGHVMTCLLAYYLEWHMRRRLASLLYDEEEPERAVKGSPVMGSGHGEATVAKRKKRRTADGEWLWNFRSLLGEMRSLTRNRVRFRLARRGRTAGGVDACGPEPAAAARARLAAGAAEALKPTQ